MYSILNYMYNSLGQPRLHTKSVLFVDHSLATFAPFLNFFFILYDFLLLSNIASCAGEGIHAAMLFLILPEIYPARSRGETHFRRCMFCTTSGLCTSGQKRGNYSWKYIYKDIFSRILHGTGRNKWNPAINHQKYMEHLYFIQKLLLEVQKSTLSSLYLKNLLGEHFYHR